MNTINEHFEFGDFGGVFGGDEYTQEEWLDIIQEIKEEIKHKDEEMKKLKEKNEMFEVLKKDEEMKKQMKERFIQLKIEEAKKKKIGNQQEGSLWDLLPPEVERNIMYMKKVQDNMIDVGDIVKRERHGPYTYESQFYKIVGETKTQYRVKQITRTIHKEAGPHNRSTYIIMTIPRNEEDQELVKHKNISKKNGRLRIVKEQRLDEMYKKYEEDGLNWIMGFHDLWGAR